MLHAESGTIERGWSKLCNCGQNEWTEVACAVWNLKQQGWWRSDSFQDVLSKQESERLADSCGVAFTCLGRRRAEFSHRTAKALEFSSAWQRERRREHECQGARTARLWSRVSCRTKKAWTMPHSTSVLLCHQDERCRKLRWSLAKDERHDAKMPFQLYYV